MTRDPLVSVVIPAYNAATFIERTLGSVREQTFTDYEVIVVDDGSADDTTPVVERYLERHHLAGRCIRQANKKIAGARNTGMRAAKGRLVALLDHDDLWYPAKLEKVVAVFEKDPAADLVCHDENVTRDGKIVRTLHYGPRTPRFYERLLFKGNSLSPSASTFLREKALAIGGFDERPEFNTVEDYDFWMRFSRVNSIVFLPLVLGEYQLVQRAASRQLESHHRNLETMIRSHLDAYRSAHPGLASRTKCRARLGKVYEAALYSFLKYDESPSHQRKYLLSMLATWPFSYRTLGCAGLWMVKTGRRRFRESLGL